MLWVAGLILMALTAKLVKAVPALALPGSASFVWILLVFVPLIWGVVHWRRNGAFICGLVVSAALLLLATAMIVPSLRTTPDNKIILH